MIKINHSGRLGNILFQDIGVSILSKKFNFYVKNYSNNYDGIKLNLNQGSECILNEIINVTDENVDEILKLKNINCGLNFASYMQTSFFVTNFKKEIKNHFIENKIFKKEGVFVHVRLDDKLSSNPGLKYYEYCLDKLNIKMGFVSSDTPNHSIVTHLSQKYNLSIYNDSPGNTIMFAKNFDNLILSAGTFSWWIGFLSEASNIFYPKNDLNWHGNIFVYNDWQGI